MEDQSLVGGLTARFLEQLGYCAVQATGGRRGHRHAAGESADIHLVLTDVIMPDLSGPDLVQRLRQEGLHPRVLYMSGYAENVIEARGQTLDAPLLQKPFTLGDIARAVRQVLDEPEEDAGQARGR